MGFSEFKELWSVLNGWRQHFTSFDSDRSGTVDPQELQKALTTMGVYGEGSFFKNFLNLLHEGSFCILEVLYINSTLSLKILCLFFNDLSVIL